MSAAALLGSGISFGTLVGIISALGVATLGVAAIVTLVIAITGVGGTGVTYSVKCYLKYLDIEDNYAIIKYYGTKL